MKSNPGAWLVGAIFALAGLVVLSIGWWEVGLQQYRLMTYLPVSARVIESHVDTFVSYDKNGSHTSYKPVVTYFYTINSRTYQSKHVTVIAGMAASSKWARNIRNRYLPGTQTTAWYSPRDPSQSFLLHEADFGVYIVALAPILFVMLGAGIVFVGIFGSRRPVPPAPLAEGKFRLAPKGSIRGKRNFFIVLTIVWYGYSAITVGDYFFMDRRNFDLFCAIATAVCGFLGLIPLLLARRYWLLDHDFLDGELYVNRNQFLPGDSITIYYRQAILTPLQIEVVSVGAVCVIAERARGGKNSNVTTREKWSKWESMPVAQAYAANSFIDGEVPVTFPVDADASSSAFGPYPHYYWFIGLRIKAKGQPKLDVQFPIVMEAKNVSMIDAR
jgi:hypothetical protein